MNPGMTSAERLHDGWERVRRGHRGHRDRELTADEPLAFPHLELESAHAAQDARGAGEKCAPIRGERHAPAAALEERDAELGSRACGSRR
jgi:hypothetical protein